MRQHASEAIQRAVTPVEFPPLENGDHLTRHEFERRSHARSEIKKAELIDGIVYVRSSMRFRGHGEPHAGIVVWLGTYCTATLGVYGTDSATVRLDLDNEVQPDALLRLEPAAGGCSHISEDDYVEGAPELIIEIAASSASYDLHDKLRVYRRNGVQEYLVWRVYDKQMDWFRLVNEEHVLLASDASGIIHSQVFPGLRLAVQALLAGDLATVLAELQNGLGTLEHAAFIERLRGK